MASTWRLSDHYAGIARESSRNSDCRTLDIPSQYRPLRAPEIRSEYRHLQCTQSRGSSLHTAKQTTKMRLESAPSSVRVTGRLRKGTPGKLLGKVVSCLPVGQQCKEAVDISLADYICQGPLLRRAGIAESTVRENISDWQLLGEKLAKQLKFDADGLSDSEKLRIYHYYLPTFFWCRQQLQLHQSSSPLTTGARASPLMIGISAPQGCGKTTVVESLEHLFEECGCRAAGVSMDDFYLTAADQAATAEKYKGNFLLELRGNAGSHDLSLAEATLKSLKGLTASGDTVKLPRYDKSAGGGRGDRMGVDKWPVAEGPLDICLFEGWMLGFEPIPSETARAVDPNLEVVNTKLADYKALDDLVDAWIIIQVDDVSWVYKWRLQAEVRMRESGRLGMTDEQVEDFVSRYMPAYKAYLPGLYANGPSSAKPERTLGLPIDESRSPKP